VNFRGSTGYGKAFLNAGNGQWGKGAMQHDLSDAVAWAVRSGIADPARVCIHGASYGACVCVCVCVCVGVCVCVCVGVGVGVGVWVRHHASEHRNAPLSAVAFLQPQAGWGQQYSWLLR
jgi:dipeptidyl aminopeptidase/acylaminoacyl peptidase